GAFRRTFRLARNCVDESESPPRLESAVGGRRRRVRVPLSGRIQHGLRPFHFPGLVPGRTGRGVRRGRAAGGGGDSPEAGGGRDHAYLRELARDSAVSFPRQLWLHLFYHPRTVWRAA